MDKLKLIFRQAKTVLSRPVAIWLSAFLLITVAGIVATIHDNNHRSQQEKARLAQLAVQQKQKSNQQKKLDQTVQQHSDIFTDISDSASTTTNCERLKNRPGVVIGSGCSYSLRAHGKLTMAVVFIYESNTNYAGTMAALKGGADDPASLLYTNTYLVNQAKRYSVKDPPQIAMTFYGAYKATGSVDNLPYRENGLGILTVFKNTSKANNVPEDQYDMVHYVLLDGIYGGGALLSGHRAFTESYYGFTVPTFVHETLHLFGASDKYNNNDCNTVGTSDPFGRYNGSVPGKDIMCSNFSLGSSIINDITAREIGWQN